MYFKNGETQKICAFTAQTVKTRFYITLGVLREMKNILLVKGKSVYNSCDRYIDEWAAAIRKLGCNTCVLDGWSFAHPKFYNHIISSYHFDAMIDLNGGLILWNATKTFPKETIYGFYLCDPPVCMKERLMQADERTIVFACDRNFCSYMDKYYAPVKHTKFIPLSGEAYPDHTPYKDRSMDVVFTGTYEDAQATKWEIMSKFEPEGVLAKFAEDLLTDIIESPQHTLPECLARVLDKYQVKMSDSEFDELVDEFYLVDFYARFYYREKVLLALLDAGITVHVFGNGWERFPLQPDHRLLIHKGGTYAAQKAVANAKISLNVMPWFKDAFQERIASAMLSKTIAATDESKYILEKFTDGEDLLVYSLKDLETFAKRVKKLLDHPDEAAKIAERGYEKVQRHTWSVRAHEMLKAMEETFGVSLIGKGEGQELVFEAAYPDKHTMRLDAVFELNKMADFAENEIGNLPQASDTDVEMLLCRFERFWRQFSSQLNGLKPSAITSELLKSKAYRNNPKHIAELFSMQCRALIGKVLMEDQELKP